MVLTQRDRDALLSQESGLLLKEGVRELARAAACEEMLDDGSHSEVMLWYIVRSLCAECGHDYAETVKSARAYARRIANRND